MPEDALFGAVVVRDPRRHDPNLWTREESRNEPSEIGRVDDRIGIEKEDRFVGAECGSLVGCGRETGIHVILDHVVSQTAGDPDAPVLRGVVDDDDVRVGVEGAQHARDVLRRLVSDDDHVDLHLVTIS